MEALTKFAKALHVRTDSLLVDESELGPAEELAVQSEAVSAMKPHEKTLAKVLIHALIVQAQWPARCSAMQVLLAAKAISAEKGS